MGTAGSFTVTATGSPTPTLTETGALASGVTFKDKGNRTATLGGTPASGSSGSYTLTITASNGVGSTASQSYTLTVSAPPDFSATAAPTSQTVSAGQNATFTLNFTPSNSFAGTVALSCAVTPQMALQPTCNLSNFSVQLSDTTTSSVTVTVGTTAPITTGSTFVPTHFLTTTTLFVFVCAALLVGIAWRFTRNHTLRPLAAALLLAISLLALASCGGGGSGSSHTTPGTPAGTYTATVTGASGSLNHTTTMTMVVR